MREFRILVVDKNPQDFARVRDSLTASQRMKFHVDWLSDHDRAPQALRDDCHDVYIIEDEIEIQRESHGSIPVIILIGHKENAIESRDLKLGAVDYLVKNEITTPALERAIRYSLKRSQDLATLRERDAHMIQQDRLASLGLLASSLAHEIGTPLGVIRGRAELLTQELVGQESPKKNLDIIIAQIDRVSKLIQSLLHISRERDSTRTESVDVREVFESVSILMNHEVKKNGIALVLDFDENVQVIAEPEALGQVLLNLFMNAIYAIEIAKENGRLDGHKIIFSAKRDRENWNLDFSDTGCGISEKNMKNMFKPFFTTKDIGVGTGLGLATCYKIVHSWGGTIHVDSKENISTRFQIQLKRSINAEA